MEDQECSCCVSKFSVRRKPVLCPKCKFTICNQCFERYTLDNLALDYVGTMCMNCKEPLSFDFIISNTNKTFIFKKWRDKRKEILIGIETAKLPDTQNSANSYKETKNKMKSILNKIEILKQQLLERFAPLDNEPTDNYCYYNYSSGSDEFPYYKIDILYQLINHYERKENSKKEENNKKEEENKEKDQEKYQEKSNYYKDLYNEAVELRGQIKTLEKKFLSKKFDLGELERLLKINDDDTVEIKQEIKERRTFIMACPLRDCKGFLSSGYKCGLCNGKICSKCHVELKDKDEEHVCDKNMVESVKAINSETKPCPKCAARISKVNGCDQMWCINCKTAFSWDTGKIVQGERIHNPEYYRWMREHHQNIPRVENQVGCEEIPPYYKINEMIYNGVISNQTGSILSDIYRMVNHINDVEIPKRKMKINRDLRVKYLVNEINTERLRIELIKRERFNMRNTFVIGMFRVIVDVIIDKLRLIVEKPSQEILDNSLIELVELCRYVNTQMENFTKVHKLKTPKLIEDVNNLFQVVKVPRKVNKNSKSVLEDDFDD